MTNELLLACTHLGLDRHDLKSIIIYGFKRSFFPGSYLRKRQYVRQIIDYYEQHGELGTELGGARAIKPPSWGWRWTSPHGASARSHGL